MRFSISCGWAVLALAANAAIIDRIAVSVGRQVISQSDLEREIRVTAFLDRVQPDFTPEGKRQTASRLVEQKLIQRELVSSRYPAPEASEVEPDVEKFKRENFADGAAYQAALAAYGISDQDVRDELLWLRTLLRFVEVRFRPGVEAKEQEIQEYFEKVVAPAARAAHPGETVDLEDYREQIERKLTGDRADREMDAWLTEARKRTEIVYHQEVFR